MFNHPILNQVLGQSFMATSLSTLATDTDTWIKGLQILGWLVGALLAYLTGRKNASPPSNPQQ